ncbi:MAG: 16S rRNA processing protein RimM, partial [Holophagales bacterium]|nr:16S rRNA processing protein RimM [Holophagales bacterium]
EVLIDADSEKPERFRTGSRLRADVGGRGRQLEVASSRPHRGRQLVRFADVTDRNGAEELRGALLEVPEDQVPAAEDGTFYYFQLVGCRVVDRRLGELGEVTGVVEDGGGVLLEVAAPEGDGGSVLVPFANALLPEIDVGEGLIVSDLPEGLLEACGSMS